MDSKDAQIAELKARVAALEATLASAEEEKYTSFTGYTRYDVAGKLDDAMLERWPNVTDRFGRKICIGQFSQVFHQVLKELDAEAADRKAHPEKYEEDSEWDFCSCMTPECCYDRCQTSEDFKEWVAEEKEQGVEHRLPVRDFKKARRGPWGLERRIAEVENTLERMKKSLAEEKATAKPDNWTLKFYREEIAKHEEELEHLSASLAEFPVTKVKVTVPVDPGTLTCVVTPERALKLAVHTRHMGLGVGLRRDTMRISTQMKLGEAEQLVMHKRLEP